MKYLRSGLFAILLLLVGCSIEESELYGSYLVKYPFGSELLEINKDSTYRQVAIIYDKPDTIIHDGKWTHGAKYTHIRLAPDTIIHTGKWEHVADYGDIRLVNALGIAAPSCQLDSTYAQPLNGVSLYSYYKYFPWSNIRLAAGCEGYYYEKIE